MTPPTGLEHDRESLRRIERQIKERKAEPEMYMGAGYRKVQDVERLERVASLLRRSIREAGG